ncbi:hypothetical protein [Flavobacterium hiemivividum]|uniref:hypothetical protein n=1 Tax=Flavobacterium hiemivividum TaxID=2541734 RepID=UPI001FB5D3CC|nr:hypothetical protein [Flavobacterium hiemivividum]
MLSKSQARAFFLGGTLVTFLIFIGIKFLLVAFDVMELKKANSFWKVSLISTLLLIIALLILLK